MVKTLIVSAFFKIPSKQPYNFYYNHLQRWFRSIKCPIIFFTSEDVYHDIIKMGYSLSHVQFEIMSVNDFTAWKLGREFWERQMNRDPEKYHTPELAAIWYEKKEFVQRACQMTDADVFIWCDAGAIRNDISEKAAQCFGLRNMNINDDRIHIQCINTIQYSMYYTYPACKYAGAIIAGNRDAWKQFAIIYNHIVKEYDNAGVSCNSDQYIMMSCNDHIPKLFYEHVPSTSEIDPWFFFLAIL